MPRNSGRSLNRNSRSRNSGRSLNRNSRNRSNGRNPSHPLRNRNNGHSPKLRTRRRRATMAGTKVVTSQRLHDCNIAVIANIAISSRLRLSV
jgi:hypothetical protein